MIRNEISLTITRRYEIQKIYRAESYRLEKTQKLENAKRTSTRIIFSRECSVFGLGVRRRKEYLVAFHGAQQRRNRCAQHTEKSERSKENLRRRSFFLFSFPPSFSLSLSFFSSVEYNSSPCSKILKIVVPADVSQWH